MDFLLQILDYFRHMDTHLADLLRQYGGWTYAILFLIIFCETGLVVTPFLPRARWWRRPTSRATPR